MQMSEDAQGVEDNPGEFYELYSKWAESLQSIIESIAAEYQCSVQGDTDRSGSRYPVIVDRDESEVISVRIADHPQRYGGIQWSFELNDEESSINRGLDLIEKKCKENLAYFKDESESGGSNPPQNPQESKKPEKLRSPDYSRYVLKAPPDRTSSIADAIVKALKSPESPGQHPALANVSPRPNQSPWSSFMKKPAGANSGEYVNFDDTKSSWPVREVRDSSKAKMRSPANSGDSDTSGQSDSRKSSAQYLRDTSRKIVNHENAHAAVLRDSGVHGAVKPKLTETQGPDGRKYAVAGEVNSDLGSPNQPGGSRVAEKKAESVYRSAIGDTQGRSDEDDETARQAQFAAQEARQKRLDAKMKRGWQQELPEMESSRETPRGMQFPGNRNADCSVSQMKWPCNKTQMKSPSMSINQGLDASGGRTVKMKSPLIAAIGSAVGSLGTTGAAIATGARSVSGLFTAGSRASTAAAGVTRARTAASARAQARATDLGYSPAAVRRAGIRASLGVRDAPDKAELLNKAFVDLRNSVQALNSVFGETKSRLHNFSPEIAMQSALNQINQMNQNIQQGRQLGKPLAEFERQQGRFNINQNQIVGDTQAWVLPLFNSLYSQLNSLIGIVSAAYKALSDWILTPAAKGFEYLVYPITFSLEKIEGFVKWMVGMAEKDRELHPNTDQFLNMELPMPGAMPNIGPGGLKPPNIPMGIMPPLPNLAGN